MKNTELKYVANRVVVRGSEGMLYEWVEIEELGLRPGYIYKKGVIDLTPGMNIDIEFALNTRVLLIKAVPAGTKMWVWNGEEYELKVFFSPEEFRKLVRAKPPPSLIKDPLGYCPNCGAPFYERIIICETCGKDIR